MLAPLGGDHPAGWVRCVVINVGPTFGSDHLCRHRQGGQSGCGHGWSYSSRSGETGGWSSCRFVSSRGVTGCIVGRFVKRWPRRSHRRGRPIRLGQGISRRVRHTGSGSVPGRSCPCLRALRRCPGQGATGLCGAPHNPVSVSGRVMCPTAGNRLWCGVDGLRSGT